MKEFKYVIQDPEGIHARPAGVLVQKAKEFNSNITIFKDEKKADAKKIFNVMALCCKQGCEILVNVEGDDEEAAAAAIEECLKENM